MARHGRPPAPRAGIPATVLALFALVPPHAVADDRDAAVMASLAVQTAMQQGRDLLLHNNARAAVEILETQLPRADGNEKYLVLLRDAYRAYVRELRAAHQEAACDVYLKRLSILDPAVVKGVATPAGRPSGDEQVRPPRAPSLPQAPSPGGAASAAALSPAARSPVVPLAAPIVARGRADDECDPFRQPMAGASQPGRDVLARAEDAFTRRNYREAGNLYAKATEIDRQIADACRDRWAYCKLHQVVEHLNRGPAGCSYAELEAEVRKAQELAPRLGFAKELLAEIDRRRGSATDAPRDRGADLPATPVRHGERTPEGWDTAESSNFRVYHVEAREMAEQVARVAERTRSEMQRKWFGSGGETWSPRCEIILYPTGYDYSRATGAPPMSPGHSSFNIDRGRVLSRRIELHCDDPNLLVAVLPHETTHTVLAGNFGEHQVPRWADEGMAVLSEPREKVERHLRNLPKHRQGGELFSLQQLVHINDYPEPRYVGAFYAESVSLVDFLVKEKGAVVFTRFVRDGLGGGYEASLQRHYGYRSFSELEQRWLAYAFAGPSAPAGVAHVNP